MIPTSPSGSPRGGGEVGITEAQRSDRVFPGRRDAGQESRHAAPAGAGAALCGQYVSSAQFVAEEYRYCVHRSSLMSVVFANDAAAEQINY